MSTEGSVGGTMSSMAPLSCSGLGDARPLPPLSLGNLGVEQSYAPFLVEVPERDQPKLEVTLCCCPGGHLQGYKWWLGCFGLEGQQRAHAPLLMSFLSTSECHEKRSESHNGQKM